MEDTKSKRQCHSTLEISFDRLSSLSDPILIDILSLLPLNVAVSTSVLSRRWRHLWTQITAIDFSDFFKAHPIIDHSVFFSIVDDFLARITSLYICKFTLFVNEQNAGNVIDFTDACCRYRRMCCSQVESLIGQVSGCFVKSMDIDVNCQYQPWIPPCVFRSRSLVALSLRSNFDCKLPTRIVLPNLKKLHVVINYHHDELLQRLFRSCPRLEDLSLKVDFDQGLMPLLEEDFVVDISAPDLKRLDLRLPDVHSEVTIDPPNLEVITISENLVNLQFVKTPTSLRKACIIGQIHPVYDISNHATQMLKFIEMIASVRSLRLLDDMIDALGYLGGVVLPMLDNLIKLKVFLGHVHDWVVLLHFLLHLPNLKIMKVYVDDDLRKRWRRTPNSIPSVFPSHLNTIKLLFNYFDRCNLEVIKFILSKATVLELLEVRVCHSFMDKGAATTEELQFCEELFMYPRSSSACQIEFWGKHLKVSCKGIRIGKLDSQILCSTKL